jgi:hypothetical protein
MVSGAQRSRTITQVHSIHGSTGLTMSGFNKDFWQILPFHFKDS